MNTSSGVIHDLDGLTKEPVVVGMPITADMLKGRDEAHAATLERLDALHAEVEAGEPVVAVSGEVAHRQALGGRELERRAKRRRSAPPGPPDPPKPVNHRPVG